MVNGFPQEPTEYELIDRDARKLLKKPQTIRHLRAKRLILIYVGDFNQYHRDAHTVVDVVDSYE